MKRKTNVFGNSDDDTDEEPTRKEVAPKKKFKIPSIDQSDVHQPPDEPDEDYMNFVADEEEHEPSDKSRPVFDDNKLNRSLFLEKHKSMGLSIMEKMGYKVGSSLGQSESALKEPVKVTARQGRRGIGGEVKPYEYKEEEVENLKLKLTACKKQRVESREIMRMMKLAFELSGQYDEFLDGKDLEEIDTLWRPYAYSMQRQSEMKKVQSKESKSRALARWQSTEETEIEDREESSSRLLDYLRGSHNYCWYCGVHYSDKDDLEEHCPGKGRDVHLDS
ncbi:hypothetical protein Cantr_04281 [Candida viswanathii]|uniref:G-patch domain-containing protein n=1 Tax=Candida viswanathii TaxID=5486 RepID=A0A367XRD5_9ASCO|nr:hypothetical protein Cantr_04281 [Candida viswanathii]